MNEPIDGNIGFIVSPQMIRKFYGIIPYPRLWEIIGAVFHDAILNETPKNGETNFKEAGERICYREFWEDNSKNYHRYRDKCDRLAKIGAAGGKASAQSRARANSSCPENMSTCRESSHSPSLSSVDASDDVPTDPPPTQSVSIAAAHQAQPSPASNKFQYSPTVDREVTMADLHDDALVVDYLHGKPITAKVFYGYVANAVFSVDRDSFALYAMQNHLISQMTFKNGNPASYLKLKYNDWKKSGKDRPDLLHRVTRDEYDAYLRDYNKRGGLKIQGDDADDFWAWVCAQDTMANGDMITTRNIGKLLSYHIADESERLKISNEKYAEQDRLIKLKMAKMTPEEISATFYEGRDEDVWSRHRVTYDPKTDKYRFTYTVRHGKVRFFMWGNKSQHEAGKVVRPETIIPAFQKRVDEKARQMTEAQLWKWYDMHSADWCVDYDEVNYNYYHMLSEVPASK